LREANMSKQSLNQVSPESVKITPWNTADYLETIEDIAYYLEPEFDDGDPQIIMEALGNIARSKGMSSIATETGLGRESLYKALSSSGNLRFISIMSVLQALGIRLYLVALHPDNQQSNVQESGRNTALCSEKESNPISSLIYHVK